MELHFASVDDDKAAARVAIARLSDATDIDDGSIDADFVAVIEFVGAVEVWSFEEDARDVGMPDEADLFDAFEDGREFSGVGVDVVGEDVFVDRPAWRGMDGHHAGASFDGGEFSEESPSCGAAVWVGVIFEDFACPVAGLFCADVEIVRFVEDSEVVVAHERGSTALSDEFDAFDGVGAIPDDIAEADDVIDAVMIDFREHCGERFEVAVDVADDGNHVGPRVRFAVARPCYSRWHASPNAPALSRVVDFRFEMRCGCGLATRFGLIGSS